MKFTMTGNEFVQLAKKYDDDLDVQKLVIFTFEGTRQTYLVRGFKLGVTFGLVVSLIVACIAYLISY